MVEFLFGLGFGLAVAAMVLAGLVETGRLRIGGVEPVDEALQQRDEVRGVVRGPFQG
jgi:hypothetical protein